MDVHVRRCGPAVRALKLLKKYAIMCAAHIRFPFATDALIASGLKLKRLCNNLVKFVLYRSIELTEKSNEYLSN